MKKTIGEKIREIRLNRGLSQDEFAKELGYTSRSTINKIEKNVNDISYDKLLLLLKKYQISMNEFLDDKGFDFQIDNNENSIFISFSGRDKGNCYDIAHHLLNANDSYISFKDISYHSCSNCEYECFNKRCKYKDDDVYKLYESALSYKNIVLLVPMYCSNPSSLYFTYNERMQDYFSLNSEKWKTYISKLKIIAIFGSEKETPLFIPTLLQLVDDDESKILKIERHNYNLKMCEKVIDNSELIDLIDSFNSKILH